MTDINYAELILTALSDHAIRGHFGCVCGWRPGLSLNDTEADKWQHRVHQVGVLSDAGLIPTSTEWGVRFVGDTTIETYADEADAHLAATDIDSDGLVSRAVTDWKDA